MKDFKNWFKLKKEINVNKRTIRFYPREIWWCSLGANVGFEQDGKNNKFERPVLILRKFNDSVLWILPLTKSNKNGRYYCRLENNGIKYSIILSQVKLICAKRLLRRIRKLSKSEFTIVKNKFKDLL